MIVFVEGPDNKGMKELYECAKTSIRNTRPKRDGHVYFYDTFAGQAPSCERTLIDRYARVRMAMELSHEYSDTRFVICGGPMSLVMEAMAMDNIDIAKTMSALFFSEYYQRISVVSVSSMTCDKSDMDSYRSLSSRHMTVMSDAGKKNSYRLFINKGEGASNKLFTDDILALINN